MSPAAAALALGALLTLVACSDGSSAADPKTSPPSTQEPSTSPAMQDIMGLEAAAPLNPGAYYIDPDGDPSTPLRVVFEVPVEGWSEWIGAARFADEPASCPSGGCGSSHVAVSISTVANLVTDGCLDHTWASPAVGPRVEDLASALTRLEPFRVTSPPKDVTAYGYPATHLAWIVPNLPVAGHGDNARFVGCDEGRLKSWVAFVDTAERGDAFYGYTGPGYREEFWLLNVHGTRLMIAAGRSPGSSPQALAELRQILDSIAIEP